MPENPTLATLILAQDGTHGTAQSKKLTQLEEIISAITEIAQAAIEAKIAHAESGPTLASILDAIEFDKDAATLTYYCSKTGQPCGGLSMEEFAELVQIHGHDGAKNLIRIRAHQHVCLKWIKTDSIALDKLSELDLYGYFVYAASMVLKPLQIMQPVPGYTRSISRPTVLSAIPIDDRGIYEQQLLECKKALYRDILQHPIKTVIRANEIMRHYLAFCKTEKALPQLEWRESDMNAIATTPALLMQYIQDLQRNIGNILRHEFTAKRINRNLTYENIVSLQDIYIGHSNFRGQRRAKELSQTEQTLMQLKDFMPDISPTHMEVIAGDRVTPLFNMKKSPVITGKDLQNTAPSAILRAAAKMDENKSFASKKFNLKPRK